MRFDRTQHEGLCLGGASGIEVSAASRIARKLDSGHTTANILSDLGRRYPSKLFAPALHCDKGLPVPPRLEAL